MENDARALAHYDLAPPIEIFILPNAGGINNRIRGVRTGAETYVWKTYLTHRNPAVIRYEHRLLRWLAAQPLSFATPVPLPTRTGETLCPTEEGEGWQALFSYLPGVPLDCNDPALIEALGVALGELHDTLRRYPMDPLPGLDCYAALDHIHPAVPDPFRLTPALLGLPSTTRSEALFDWWRETVRDLQVFIDGPYRTLPRQMMHGDFGPSNALAEDGRVVAIHDFEFTMPDARAIDVASGLAFVMRLWERDDEDALAMAHRFSHGHARRGGLTAAEIAALPHLMLLRDVVGAIWWTGRDLAAGDTRKSIERITAMQTARRWMREHEATFFAAVRQHD